MFYWNYHLCKNCRPSTTLMATVSPNGRGIFQQDNAACHTAKHVQEQFQEHKNVFKMVTWLLNSPNRKSYQWRPNRCNLQDLRDFLLTSWNQTPQHNFRVLVEFMPLPDQGCFDSTIGTYLYFKQLSDVWCLLTLCLVSVCIFHCKFSSYNLCWSISISVKYHVRGDF